MSTSTAASVDGLPRTFRVSQAFPDSPTLDVSATVREEIGILAKQIKPGMNIGVGVGSRGITNLRAVVETTLTTLQAAGAKPFIIPAMGSHGGATPEAQTELLGEYGLSENTLKVPFHATMEVDPVASDCHGNEVVWARPALAADGVLVINRIKPHTDFAGNLGSGLVKMAVVGLGKRTGASHFHRSACHLGYEAALRERFQAIAQNTPLLGGLGLIEDQRHQTAHVEWIPTDGLVAREESLFQTSRSLMPQIPFDSVDLLIIDRIGKNISGAGMDPNVIARSVHGYLTSPPQEQEPLTIRRIFVRDLTPETHGNAIGIGLADVTTQRLVESMNHEVTFVNALTALSTNGAKTPIYFDTDREAILRVLDTLALPRLNQAKILRIQDTLNLEQMVASEAYHEEAMERPELTPESDPAPLAFTSGQQLLDVAEEFAP